MRIGITLGDACGVGPEILIRSYAEGRLPLPALVYGDIGVLEHVAAWFGIDAPLMRFEGTLVPKAINVVDHGMMRAADVTPGQISRKAGAASVQYLDTAIDDAASGRIDAIVTLPINKAACRLTHPDFIGHTDHLADRFKVRNYALMLAAPELIATFVSLHVSLREAIELVTEERILDVIALTASASSALRKRSRIAVAGLNPHAGEGEAFGVEDAQIIEPAIAKAVAQGYDVSGPFPPDTIFMSARDGAFDAVVCMYHDQGHAPMKLMAFHDTVNVTLGLPIVRTSVDHGTAFDIAYKGIASTGNFLTALSMARQLAESRQAPSGS